MDRPSILIVDDDRLFRRVVAEELREAGYQVTEAEDGAEAMKQLDHVGLALLDYWLPDTTGVDLLKRVKESRPNMPVVILTSHPTEEVAAEAQRVGAFRYLEKPLNTLELLPVVESALDGSSPTTT